MEPPPSCASVRQTLPLPTCSKTPPGNGGRTGPERCWPPGCPAPRTHTRTPTAIPRAGTPTGTFSKNLKKAAPSPSPRNRPPAPLRRGCPSSRRCPAAAGRADPRGSGRRSQTRGYTRVAARCAAAAPAAASPGGEANPEAGQGRRSPRRQRGRPPPPALEPRAPPPALTGCRSRRCTRSCPPSCRCRWGRAGRSRSTCGWAGGCSSPAAASGASPPASAWRSRPWPRR